VCTCPCVLWAKDKFKVSQQRGDKQNAVDNFRGASGAVVTRAGQLLHNGRIHSHPACIGGNRFGHQPRQWTENSCLSPPIFVLLAGEMVEGQRPCKAVIVALPACLVNDKVRHVYESWISAGGLRGNILRATC